MAVTREPPIRRQARRAAVPFRVPATGRLPARSGPISRREEEALPIAMQQGALWIRAERPSRMMVDVTSAGGVPSDSDEGADSPVSVRLDLRNPAAPRMRFCISKLDLSDPLALDGTAVSFAWMGRSAISAIRHAAKLAPDFILRPGLKSLPHQQSKQHFASSMWKDATADARSHIADALDKFSAVWPGGMAGEWAGALEPAANPCRRIACGPHLEIFPLDLDQMPPLPAFLRNLSRSGASWKVISTDRAIDDGAEELLRAIDGANIRGLLWISAGHCTAVHRHERGFEPLVELVAGPLAASAGGHGRGRGTVFEASGGASKPDSQSFGHVQVDSLTGRLTVSLRSGADGSLLWSDTLQPRPCRAN